MDDIVPAQGVVLCQERDHAFGTGEPRVLRLGDLLEQAGVRRIVEIAEQMDADPLPGAARNLYPGTKATPNSRAATEACSHPSVESWSVRATTSRPAADAEAITPAGASVPSETLECACRSIFTFQAYLIGDGLDRFGVGLVSALMGRWDGERCRKHPKR